MVIHDKIRLTGLLRKKPWKRGFFYGPDSPALVRLACLGDLGRPSALAPAAHVSLRQARDEWLRRLDAQQKSESTLVGYRVAIDDLLDWPDATHHRNPARRATG